MPAHVQPGMIVVGLLIMALLLASLSAWVGLIVWVSLGNKLWTEVRTRRIPWGGWSVLGVIALNLGLQFAAGFGRRAFMGNGDIPPRELLILVVAINFACLILIPAFLHFTSGARAKDLGFWSNRLFTDIARGALGCLLIAPPVYGLMGALNLRMGRRPHPLEKMILEGLTWQNVVVATLAAVVTAPLTEELLFRGVLLGWLTKVFSGTGDLKKPVEISEEFGDAWAKPNPTDFEFDSPYQPPSAPLQGSLEITESSATSSDSGAYAFWMPNVLTSILFAGLHFGQWPAPIPLFFLSLGLGYLTQKTGSIVPSITLHACFNGISTAMLFLLMAFRIKPS